MPVTLQVTGLKYRNSQGQFQSADCLKGESADISFIAPEFDAMQVYSAGAYVMHNGALYLLYEGHTANVTWENTAKYATAVSGVLENLDDNFQQLYGEKLSLSDVAPQYDDLTFPISKGQICVYEDGNLYEAKQDIPTSESWTPGKWQYITIGEKLTSLAGLEVVKLI